MTGRSGSVLIESAFTLTLTLLLLYGALQLGIVGLEQVTADGGAYTAAHQQSFSGGQVAYDGVALAKATLTHLQSPNVTIAPQIAPPPATSFNGLYSFDQPNARYGGVSLVQPVQSIVRVTTNQLESIVMGLTGSPLSVTGTSVEPTYQLINPHFDVAGFDFGSADAFNHRADPLEDNAPPYFVGFSYMQLCPYSDNQNNFANKSTVWTNCPFPSLSPAALGLAEYLDANNWARPTNGVTPATSAVFWEMAYHQARYASISQTLPGATSLADKIKILDPTGVAAGSADVACVYSFDNSYWGAYSPGYNGSGDPLFSLHPDGSNGPTCAAP